MHSQSAMPLASTSLFAKTPAQVGSPCRGTQEAEAFVEAEVFGEAADVLEEEALLPPANFVAEALLSRLRGSRRVSPMKGICERHTLQASNGEVARPCLHVQLYPTGKGRQVRTPPAALWRNLRLRVSGYGIQFESLLDACAHLESRRKPNPARAAGAGSRISDGL